MADEQIAAVLKTFTTEYLSASVVGVLQDAVAESVQQGVDEGKGEVEQKKEVKEGESQSFVCLEVTSRRKRTDIDTSEYTSLDVTAAYVRPEHSRVTCLPSRYKYIREAHADAEKASKSTGSVKLPEFPGKKLTGNMNEEFVKKRMEDINKFFVEAEKEDGYIKQPSLLASYSLIDDPERAKNRSAFIDAYEGTRSKHGLSANENPEDFHDEGEALCSLVVGVLRREVFPEIAIKFSSIPVRKIRSGLIERAQKAVAQTAGKSVNKSWETAREDVKKARNTIISNLEVVKPKIKEVVANLVVKVMAKLKKKQEEGEANLTEEQKKQQEEEAKEEAKEAPVEPGFDTLPIARKLRATVENEAKCSESFKKLLEEVLGAKKTKNDLVKKIHHYSDLVPIPATRYALRKVIDAVSGVSDLWFSESAQLLKGLRTILEAKDKLEEILSQVESKRTEAIEEAQKYVEEMDAALKAAVRKHAISMGVNLGSHRTSLRFELRVLPRYISGPVMELIEILPALQLDLLFNMRMRVVAAFSSLVKGTVPATNEETARLVRRTFVDAVKSDVDLYIRTAWERIVSKLKDCSAEVFVAEIWSLVDDEVQEAVGAIKRVLPSDVADQLNKDMMESIIKTALKATADALNKKLEKMAVHQVFEKEANN